VTTPFSEVRRPMTPERRERIDKIKEVAKRRPFEDD
jgi:hypothetical protein